ncbi:pyridoxamine 5'-phosphate oxidase family protein [Dethiobacter alkaliphilus]|uniref:Pyridoxamine 5'-phosphate oxidase-related FMN-binding n=1 Tax=Dethiobacter alkaliphilus AHT 1 TaxID=555088 RepID=C0GFI2_DETAL|nr:pyridoxamine 5'-phosphate oxidase family protein [Dethiobacter alkaliphilus]EEG77942.1 pyridoxamine 5'-phosphate oxidase-related FMN-binding [Dethiobacter alkaliphilus AHT 1]
MMRLPKKVLSLLHNEKFCSLATCFQNKPHLSLMNFTFLPEEQVIILSSREDTTKINYIQKNPEVSLLVYSFKDKEPFSCTIYGTAEMAGPEQSRIYRKIHLMNHPDMSAFIEGDNIAIIIIGIQGISLSDINDNVRTWS